jgi:hypothetical protein
MTKGLNRYLRSLNGDQYPIILATSSFVKPELYPKFSPDADGFSAFGILEKASPTIKKS